MSEENGLEAQEIEENASVGTKAFDELTSMLDASNEELSEFKEKQDKIEVDLEKHDEVNKKMLAVIKAERGEREALEEKYQALERKFDRAPVGSEERKESKDFLDAFVKFTQYGKDTGHMDSKEIKYLRTDSDVGGGYLCPPETSNEIIKDVTEISAMRSVSRVRQTSSKSIEVPKRTGLPTAGFIGEGSSFSESEASYGMLDIPNFKLGVVVIVSTEMLEDSAFSMESEILSDVVTDSEQVEGQKFVDGVNGLGEPEGFMTNGDVEVISSEAVDAASITFDDFFELQGSVKTGYNNIYTINRRSIATVRKFKGGDGQYLWAAASDGQPATLAGDPYLSVIDMDDIGSSTFPVAYGDFFRGYTIVDRVGMTMLRDPFTLGADGKVKFIFHRRVGGQVVLAEAIKKLQATA